jgi:hypothetical protein
MDLNQLPANYRSIAAKPMDRWLLAADIGKENDPTALCVMRHLVVPGTEWVANAKSRTWRQARSESFRVYHLERLPLGLAYPVQAARVGAILARPPLDAGCDFSIDETGVGKAVGDIFDTAGLNPKRITITAGLEPTMHGGRDWHVPKAALISNLEAHLHTGELKIADTIADSEALKEELKDFNRKVSEAGRVTWGARGTKHDDIVLAVAIALWDATHRVTSGSEELLI